MSSIIDSYAGIVNFISEAPLLICTDDVDDSGDVSYIGYAEAGASADGLVWRIKKIWKDGYQTLSGFAKGSPKMEFAWTKRASYTYS